MPFLDLGLVHPTHPQSVQPVQMWFVLGNTALLLVNTSHRPSRFSEHSDSCFFISLCPCCFLLFVFLLSLVDDFLLLAFALPLAIIGADIRAGPWLVLFAFLVADIRAVPLAAGLQYRPPRAELLGFDPRLLFFFAGGAEKFL